MDLSYAGFVQGVRVAVFWLGAAAAVVALLDWLVRTRRMNPFGPVARFMRRSVDPLMRPIEERIVRAGGQPSSAPWWTLVVIVVGGLLLIALLDFLGGLARQAQAGLSSPRGMWALLVAWTLGILRLALIVRVLSSWFGLSEFSRWIRWTIPLTEWMLAPLRRIVPAMGPVDVTPLVAFILLAIIQGVLT